MKRIALTTLIGLTLAVAACDDGTDALTNGQRSAPDPNATAGGSDSTFDHANDPGGSSDAVTAVKVIGNPEVTSRLHGCGKISYASLGDLLATRGMTGTGGGRPAGAQSSQQLYTAAGPALGIANYNGRVPEAPFASTSAMAKMFDIFSMAAYDATAAAWTAPACPGVKVVQNNQFTKDGLSCLMGKPATDEHLAIANDAIAKNPTDGAKIAIAALLSAAHTCQ